MRSLLVLSCLLVSPGVAQEPEVDDLSDDEMVSAIHDALDHRHILNRGRFLF